jgi:hypothetical protein
MDDASGRVDVADFERKRFADPKARSIHDHRQGLVARLSQCAQQ